MWVPRLGPDGVAPSGIFDLPGVLRRLRRRLVRLRPPRAGFSLAWGGDLGDMDTHASKRRRDLNAALSGEEAAGSTSVGFSAEWAPVTAGLLERIRDGLSRTWA